jgi:hypothetical protein
VTGAVFAQSHPEGMVAYYPFEGDASDVSGNLNHGTIVGDVIFVEGLLGQAASFDGDDDHIIVGESPDFDFRTSPFTFSAWICLNLDGQTGHDHDLIFSIGTVDYQTIGFGRYTGDNWDDTNACPANDCIPRNKKGVLCASGDAAGFTCVHTSQDVPYLEWHHLVATRDGNMVKMYLDGQLEDSELLNGDIVLNNYELKIGSHYLLLNDDFDFNGLIDELRIYNRALSEAEIQALYEARITPKEMLEELTGTVISLNIKGGISNAFDAKLERAISALDDVNENNDIAAINSLNAFINAVEAQRGQHITNEDADLLVAAAQAIITKLESQ